MDIIYGFSFAQSQYQLKGSVVDEKNEPLKDAYVFLYPVKKGATTDANGNFTIPKLSGGKYTIEISFVGYKTLIDTITIARNKTYRFQLEATALSLQEVVVTDHYAETRKKEESLNIEIVNDEFLKQNLGGSLMNSLERLPGVTTIDIGSN
jgi:iron complex outermembrane receptor protein